MINLPISTVLLLTPAILYIYGKFKKFEDERKVRFVNKSKKSKVVSTSSMWFRISIQKAQKWNELNKEPKLKRWVCPAHPKKEKRYFWVDWKAISK